MSQNFTTVVDDKGNKYLIKDGEAIPVKSYGAGPAQPVLEPQPEVLYHNARQHIAFEVRRADKELTVRDLIERTGRTRSYILAALGEMRHAGQVAYSSYHRRKEARDDMTVLLTESAWEWASNGFVESDDSGQPRELKHGYVTLEYVLTTLAQQFNGATTYDLLREHAREADSLNTCPLKSTLDRAVGNGQLRYTEQTKEYAVT